MDIIRNENIQLLIWAFSVMFSYRRGLREEDLNVPLTSPEIGLSSYDLYMFYRKMQQMTNRKLDVLFGDESFWTIGWIADTLASAGICLKKRVFDEY